MGRKCLYCESEVPEGADFCSDECERHYEWIAENAYCLDDREDDCQ